MAAGINPIKSNPNRIKQYKKIVDDFYQVQIPMSLNSLRLFEKLNKISVTVFKYVPPNPRVIYCSKYNFKKIAVVYYLVFATHPPTQLSTISRLLKSLIIWGHP